MSVSMGSQSVTCNTESNRRRNFTTIVRKLSTELISKVAGASHISRLDEVQQLDLHMRGESQGEIVLIENLEICPNLKLLNLSYNSIKVIWLAEY